MGEKGETDNGELLGTHMDPKEQSAYTDADLSCDGTTNNNSNCGYQQDNHHQLLTENQSQSKDCSVPGQDSSIYSTKLKGKSRNFKNKKRK